jgi:molecular chaperone DnaK
MACIADWWGRRADLLERGSVAKKELTSPGNNTSTVLKKAVSNKSEKSMVRRSPLMSDSKEVCAGIDLGTSNSVIAVLVNGKPEVIPNKEGDRLTPSVVAYRQEVDGSVSMLVGKPARQQAHLNPENTFASVKRFIGRQASELSDEELERPSYRVEKAGSSLRIYCPLLDRLFAPEEISSQVLRKISGDASDFLGGGREVKDVVITVPAYFGDSQRLATKDAGKIAGLNVLRILNEPTGASLVWGLGKAETQVALIFDLGGGTFDVSIVEVGEGVFEVLATSGDTELGGDDFDRCISDWMVSSFEKVHGVDLSKDPLAMQRVTTASEKMKVELSSLSQAGAELPFIADKGEESLHLSLQLTRESFENMCKDLLDRCRSPLEQALKDAKMTPDDINQVVTVGGSTRIPMVTRLVEEMMGRPPIESVNPDEAVAMGAALQSGVIKGEVSDVVLLDVVPISLGIVIEGNMMAKLIERNSPIPISQSQTFTTAADNQPTVEIVVVQGERELASANKILGRFLLTGIDPAPSGEPVIKVTFGVTVDGTLSVSAKDEKSGSRKEIVVEGASTLSKEEVDSMLESAERSASQDKEDLRTTLLMARALVAPEKLKEVTDPNRESEKTDLLRNLENARRANDVSLVEEILLQLCTMYPQAGILPDSFLSERS